MVGVRGCVKSVFVGFTGAVAAGSYGATPFIVSPYTLGCTSGPPLGFGTGGNCFNDMLGHGFVEETIAPPERLIVQLS